MRDPSGRSWNGLIESKDHRINNASVTVFWVMNYLLEHVFKTNQSRKALPTGSMKININGIQYKVVGSVFIKVNNF